MGQRNSNSVSFPTPLEGSTSLHIISLTRNSPILSKTWFHKVIKYIIEQSILLVLLPHPADKNLNSLIFRNFRIFFFNLMPIHSSKLHSSSWCLYHKDVFTYTFLLNFSLILKHADNHFDNYSFNPQSKGLQSYQWRDSRRRMPFKQQ